MGEGDGDTRHKRGKMASVLNLKMDGSKKKMDGSNEPVDWTALFEPTLPPMAS
jgi:hypothetical protein